MRLLADESLAGRTRQFLRSLGDELITVDDLGHVGAANGEVLALAKAHEAILIAEDRGFGNLLDYPLGTHRGIIVMKIHSADDYEPAHRHLAAALKATPANQLTGALLIVDRNKSRLRRPA